MINPYAVGKTVYLRAPNRSDAGGRWHEWFSDPEVTEFLIDRWWPNTPDEQVRFFESIAIARDRLVLAICRVDNDEHIGVCNLSAINWVHRSADVALVIGEKSQRNGTVAVETMALLLAVAFNRLNLLNLRSSHIEGNRHTPGLERLFGFIEAGRFKKAAFRNGTYVDVVWSQLTRDAWAARNAE
jgi:ribosomal-protein-alanine N-acetyltransferase